MDLVAKGRKWGCPVTTDQMVPPLDLSRYGYKPGYRFVDHTTDPAQRNVEIQILEPIWLTPKPARAGPGVPLGSWRSWAYVSPEHDEWQLYQLVMQIERHEALEWFRRNGRCVYEPHNGDGTARYFPSDLLVSPTFL